MLVAHMLVTFGICFLAGMHWTIWDEYQERSSLYWSLGLTLLGFYAMISMIGHVTKIN